MRHLLSLCLILGLALAAGAEQLWVSNRPFPGAVVGSGQDMMVELESFVEIMKIEADDQGDVVVVGGFPIPVERIQGTRFVHLRDVVDAARLKISSSPDLGTVDVRSAGAGLGYKGDWSSLSPDNTATTSAKGTVTEIAGDFFSVKIPSRLLVIAETEYLKSGESENAKGTNLNEYPSPMGTKTVCGVSTEADFQQGGLTMAFIPGLPADVTAQDEQEMLDVIKYEIQAEGGELIGSPASINIAGNRFYRILARQSVEKRLQDTELNIHVSKKHRAMLIFKIQAPKENFNRVAPQLRLVVNNLRLK